jgi:hypothetical protein
MARLRPQRGWARPCAVGREWKAGALDSGVSGWQPRATRAPTAAHPASRAEPRREGEQGHLRRDFNLMTVRHRRCVWVGSERVGKYESYPQRSLVAQAGSRLRSMSTPPSWAGQTSSAT